MKKTTLLLVILLISINLHSQINQTTTWPDATWTISGTFASGNLLLNPTTTDSQLKFDDSQVTNSGDVIYLKSPVINLNNALAGETAIRIRFNFAYALNTGTSEKMGLDYWDADSGSWFPIPDGQADPNIVVGTYTSCVTVLTDVYFDFSGFTVNQKNNFKYRFFYDDGGLNTGKGVCLSAPTVTSLSCNAPTNLHTTSILSNGVNIAWDSNGETNWEIESGLAGFTLGTGTVQQTTQNTGGQGGLSPNTNYDIYVRADCSGGNQDFYSAYSNKVNFTTSGTLGVEDQAIAGFSFYPNPVKDKITLTANQNIDQIEIYNLLGQNVMIKQPKVSRYDMKLNTLKTGVYFMKVQVGSKTGNYKIVKQ